MLAGANDGELESDWHSQQMAFHAENALSAVPHFLSFFLLNMLQLLPLSIGVRVCVCLCFCFVCSLMILRPHNRLLFQTAVDFGYMPGS